MEKAAAVAALRTFNRTVTERVGALSDSFLGRGRPLGFSRTLWEIGVAGAEVRDLRLRLGLDSGYMSRVLRALQGEGLVSVDQSQADGRARTVRLTAAGRKELAELDRRAERAASDLLDPLTADQRDKLVSAMGVVERLLRASLVRITIEDPTTADARWCVAQYIAELDRRFDGGFDPARSISAEPHELVPPAGLFLIARSRERPIACGALKFHRGEPAELKRMWVASDARGLGVGRRMLGTLEREALRFGARTVRLETDRALTEAIALYRSAGYREVAPFSDDPYADHWFEKDLEES